MNSTLDPQALQEKKSLSLAAEKPHIVSNQVLFSGHAFAHNPKSGLNPIADAASNLFTMIGKLKTLVVHPDLRGLQAELGEEIRLFYETVKNHGYSAEYTVICRYIMCATLDEIIAERPFADQGKWHPFSLLVWFNQDIQHQEKFFTILERIIKEPSLYIDLMELMYLCLSMEYKGQYRHLEHGQFQLDQIVNTLYKHIRAYRGNHSKTLSPTPLKSYKSFIETRIRHKSSFKTIFIVTVCLILTILISLGYLMDVISNESYKNITQSGKKA